MKTTSTCPKCKSREIVKIPGDGTDMLALGLVTSVRITRYLCCGCGFIEEWMENEKDIEKVHKASLFFKKGNTPV